jgi:hypothetical protein
MMSGESLSLHVRRGDYVTSAGTAAFHGVLDISYYQAALAQLQERVQSLQVFVFSDDPLWCRQAFEPLGLDLTFVDWNKGDESWQDLYLIGSCDHSVIANSSFSWWGAWLGDQRERRKSRFVFAPRQWFVGAALPVEDRCPPGWTTI